MAAKSWDVDFRHEAIVASVQVLKELDLEEPTEANVSYCLPLHERPVVGITPGKIMIVALVLGMALLCAGAAIGWLVAKNNPPFIYVAAGCTLTGMACLFISSFDRSILRWILGARGTELAERSRAFPLISAEVSNTDRSKMKMSIDGDDYVLLLADETERRVVIEGVSCRYQILAADVEDIQPFEFMNLYGAEVQYRITPTVSLRLAIAKVSLRATLLQQAPLFYFLLGNKIPNPVLQKVTAALCDGMQPVSQQTFGS